MVDIQTCRPLEGALLAEGCGPRRTGIEAETRRKMVLQQGGNESSDGMRLKLWYFRRARKGMVIRGRRVRSMRGRWSDIVGSPAEEKGRDRDLVQLSQYEGETTTSTMTKRTRIFMMRKIVFGSPTMNLMMKNRKIGGKGEEDQRRKAGDRGVGVPRKPWVGVQGRRG